MQPGVEAPVPLEPLPKEADLKGSIEEDMERNGVVELLFDDEASKEENTSQDEETEYEYLLSMQQRSFTHSYKDKLDTELKVKQAEYEKLILIPIEALWENDLDALEEELEKQNKSDKADTRKRKKKKKQQGEDGKRLRKKDLSDLEDEKLKKQNMSDKADKRKRKRNQEEDGPKKRSR